MLPVGHAAPHPPQFIGSVRASTSHPSTTFALQSTEPSMQSFVHVPPLQVVPGHALVHEPQWAGSVFVDTQRPAQQISLAPQFEQSDASGFTGASVLASPSVPSVRASRASSAASMDALSTSAS